MKFSDFLHSNFYAGMLISLDLQRCGACEFRKKLECNPFWKEKLRFCYEKRNHICLFLCFVVVVGFCCCWCSILLLWLMDCC